MLVNLPVGLYVVGEDNVSYFVCDEEISSGIYKVKDVNNNTEKMLTKEEILKLI